MDIHRCRFVDYPPSAINALAFSHTSGSASRNQPLRLAIGRANGDIEIWDPRKGAWLHETTLRGGKDRSVEGLAWTHDPDEKDENGYVTHGRLRLFSIGYSSTVTEWNLNTGLPLRQSSGSHSEVWCLAAQPRWRRKKRSTNEEEKDLVSADGEYRGQSLVAGCADGTLVLLSTADEGLAFQKYIARASKKNARALSLAFQSRDIVVAGFADSAIRVYDIRNGNLLRNMSVGGGPQGGPKEKLVWAVECLKDGTIVSGDSSGEVCFWDGRTYGQLQRIKSHDADTLCLVASEDGQTVFSGGMDRRTVVYNLTGAQHQRRTWAKASHRRFHQHDVKAMARFENSKTSVVVSGGLDTNPIVIPLREYGKEHHRTLPYTPQTAPVANAKRYILSWWDNEVTIWQVNHRRNEPARSDFMDPREHYRTVAQIALKGDESIAAASVSPCGSLLAVATSAETKVFHLRPRQGAQDGAALSIKKLDLPLDSLKLGARLVHFSTDSKWLLCVSPDNQIRLGRLAPITYASKKPTFLPAISTLHRLYRQRDTQNCLNGAWGSYDRTITRASFSTDGRILAVSDLAGYIDTWILEGNEDLLAPAVDVPSRDSPRSSLSRDEDSASDEDDENNAEHTIVIYGQHWARNPLAHMLPRLPSHPIILSFRPSPAASLSHLPSGNPAVHPTRHNPHAHSHSLPTTSEDRLAVLTATHELHELEVLKGRFTDWSRRNPPSILPHQFILQRDRAVGSLWDVGVDTSTATTALPQRLWLYGASWLCMFDLAKDLPRPDGASEKQPDGEQNCAASKDGDTKKRKRDHERLASKRGGTGAGSRIAEHEVGGGVAGRKVQKKDAQGRTAWLDVMGSGPRRVARGEGEDEDEDDYDDNDDEDADGANSVEDSTGDDQGPLHLLRRARAGSGDGADVDGAAGGRGHGTAFWLTNRYRPILGIVPLSSPALKDEGVASIGTRDGELDRGEEEVLEVAVVERPFWDLELPARFVGNQEWEKGN